MICVRKNADTFEVLDPSECSPLEKPPSQQACHLKPCGAKWFSTEWSVVSHSGLWMSPGRVLGPARKRCSVPVACALGSHNEGDPTQLGNPEARRFGFHTERFIMQRVSSFRVYLGISLEETNSRPLRAVKSVFNRQVTGVLGLNFGRSAAGSDG